VESTIAVTSVDALRSRDWDSTTHRRRPCPEGDSCRARNARNERDGRPDRPASRLQFEPAMTRVFAFLRRPFAVASSAGIALLMLGSFASVARAVPPVLVASEPANGATGVDPLLGSFSIVFDQPMQNQRSFSVTGPWTAGELLFVGDRSFVYFRGDPGTALPAGATITVTVNPPGSTNPFVNLAGEPAATTSFSFTIAAGSGVPSVVATVPSRGAIGVDPALDAIVVQFSEPELPELHAARRLGNELRQLDARLPHTDDPAR
jgi:hypothetical protein